MKALNPTAAHQIHGEHILCPNCDSPQDRVYDFEPGTFECENCWQHFSVSSEFIEESKGQVVRRTDLIASD